jgi:hypothetical protein
MRIYLSRCDRGTVLAMSRSECDAKWWEQATEGLSQMTTTEAKGQREGCVQGEMRARLLTSLGVVMISGFVLMDLGGWNGAGGWRRKKWQMLEVEDEEGFVVCCVWAEEREE